MGGYAPGPRPNSSQFWPVSSVRCTTLAPSTNGLDTPTTHPRTHARTRKRTDTCPHPHPPPTHARACPRTFRLKLVLETAPIKGRPKPGCFPPVNQPALVFDLGPIKFKQLRKGSNGKSLISMIIPWLPPTTGQPIRTSKPPRISTQLSARDGLSKQTYSPKSKHGTCKGVHKDVLFQALVHQPFGKHAVFHQPMLTPNS